MICFSSEEDSLSDEDGKWFSQDWRSFQFVCCARKCIVPSMCGKYTVDDWLSYEGTVQTLNSLVIIFYRHNRHFCPFPIPGLLSSPSPTSSTFQPSLQSNAQLAFYTQHVVQIKPLPKKLQVQKCVLLLILLAERIIIPLYQQVQWINMKGHACILAVKQRLPVAIVSTL